MADSIRGEGWYWNGANGTWRLDDSWVKSRRGGRRILFVARDFSSNFSSKGFSTKFASIK